MKRRKCKHCGRSFVVTARHADQTYCSQKECQRARKSEWQRRKLASDKDYQLNQADCQASWAAQHPEYWKLYRAKHPEYVQRNREKQRERNRIHRGQPPVASMTSTVANMDANHQETLFISGYYKLIPVTDTPVANMAPILVRIQEAVYPLASV